MRFSAGRLFRTPPPERPADAVKQECQNQIHFAIPIARSRSTGNFVTTRYARNETKRDKESTLSRLHSNRLAPLPGASEGLRPSGHRVERRFDSAAVQRPWPWQNHHPEGTASADRRRVSQHEGFRGSLRQEPPARVGGDALSIDLRRAQVAFRCDRG